jgi:hypothetical protein
MRSGEVARFSELLKDTACERAALQDLFEMLRRTDVKMHQPTAWLFAVRFALNLSKSPNPECAQTVIGHWRAASADPEMQAYWEIDKRFGVLHGYTANAAHYTGYLFAKL